jgi:hypothetical protein
MTLYLPDARGQQLAANLINPSSINYQLSTVNYQLTLFPLKNSSTFMRFLPSS